MGKFAVKQTAAGFKFDLKASNGEIIASSQVYKSEKTARAGVESVRRVCAAEIEDQTVEGYAPVKHPKYEVYTDKAGEIRFRLKASNGQIIAHSEGYKTKKSALNGIESIKKNAPDAAVEKVE
ncbi:MAG: YegP family protein [Firmicutes bacterium]|nr:YegP family protein [Bacillota bacterium]